jgi:diacylglycerol kinase (ATP)
LKRSYKTAILLVNPNAGRGQTNSIIASASRHFKEPQWKLLVKILTGPEEAYILAREAARKKYHAVLVAGGDGTINEVARALIGKKTALGVVPAGTGNGFARGLKIPLNIEKACAALAQGPIGKVDVGTLNGEKVFVSICGTGYDAWAARKANSLRWINRFSGFLRYLVSGVMTAFEFKPARLRITVGKETVEGLYLLACVANGEQFGFGATIAPGALLHDGLLDIVLVPPMSLWHLALNGTRMMRAKPLYRTHRLSGSKITITSLDGSETPMHVDGEFAGHCPAVIVLRPKSLNVLLPA